METYINQYDDLFRTLLRSTSELENQLVVNTKVESEVEEQRSYVNGRKKEIEQAYKETIQIKKLHDVALKANFELDEDRSAAENLKEEYMRKIRLMRDVEVLSIKREIEIEDKQIMNCKTELEVVRKKYTKGEKANRALYNLVNFNMVSKRNLFVELKTYEVESQQQKEEIRLILQEKDRRRCYYHRPWYRDILFFNQ